jgi:hypothetical protein
MDNTTRTTWAQVQENNSRTTLESFSVEMTFDEHGRQTGNTLAMTNHNGLQGTNGPAPRPEEHHQPDQPGLKKFLGLNEEPNAYNHVNNGRNTNDHPGYYTAKQAPGPQSQRKQPDGGNRKPAEDRGGEEASYGKLVAELQKHTRAITHVYQKLAQEERKSQETFARECCPDCRLGNEEFRKAKATNRVSTEIREPRDTKPRNRTCPHCGRRAVTMALIEFPTERINFHPGYNTEIDVWKWTIHPTSHAWSSDHPQQ